MDALLSEVKRNQDGADALREAREFERLKGDRKEGLGERGCPDGRCDPREVDCKDASLAREIAGIEPAAVRLGSPSAERQPDTQPASVDSALVEQGRQLLRLARPGKAATFILDFDQHTIGAGSDA